MATDPGKGLASLKAGDASTLVLHAGALAGQRSINGTPGVDGPEGETFAIGNTVDENGNLIAGTLTVSPSASTRCTARPVRRSQDRRRQCHRRHPRRQFRPGR